MTLAPMDCSRAQELLSDLLEGTLEEPLLSELRQHLSRCGECGALREALAEVVAALKAAGAPEPAADLARRAAETALRRGRPPARPWIAWRALGVPAAVQVAAAVAALAASTLVYGAHSGPGGLLRQAARLRDRGVHAGVYLVERTDRFVEDLRVLRLVVGATFGGRLDGLGERVEDYRRLIERRRATQAAPGQPPRPEQPLPGSQTLRAPRARPLAVAMRFPEPGAERGRNL